MKTIIIYSSTYGYTKDCASELSKQLKGEVLLVNVSTDKIPSLNEFDNVVIGGSIYMGQISKKIKAYCTSNIDLLKNKRVGLFLCCGLPENLEKNIKNSFPEELLKKAISLQSFGGELRAEKMKLTHKILTGFMKKSAAKEGKALAKQMPENIAKLAAIISK
ncbi:flavodoxin domain-containing protein [Clostridium bowmanii]|uniref:flavodoxin domain-containing protein n=1 Tax=Clostridium bowmanii TaxID=132925 RepID=UPI001C0D89C1|nr:flavodoxin domain-containing protein [Clostridium bowmanii]MBU3189682.1 flavodoxin domain-containing protein [Clostridium bowmanii]MCA1074164.1 flavodoxin domain-containing protein [Clostridium bowmanii]